MAEISGRSASGVRIAGDDYQHLVTWNEVLLSLQPGGDVTHITVEAADAGNVDDIVVEHANGGVTYTQVKHAVDARTPVGSDYLLGPGTGKSEVARRSILARFRDSWLDLSERGDISMQLVTDREVDSSDPLMQHLDRRTECLIPAILKVGLPRAVVRARSEWAEHLGLDEDTLLDMLAALRFRTGRPARAEEERAHALMWGHGLRTGPQALANGVTFVREWVKERDRRRSVEQLKSLMTEACDIESEPAALLIIEAIADDAHPEDATERLRFVESYEGDAADSRRQLRDTRDWTATIGPEIAAAARRLEAAGHHRVLVRGAMRQPVWFAAGAALRHVHGFDVAGVQNGTVWSSDAATAPFPTLARDTTEFGPGGDIAVAVGIATNPTSGVARYIAERGLPIDHLVTLTPPEGPGPQTITDSRAAARFAVAVRGRLTEHLDERPGEHIHLFLAVPGVLALLLGHRWNALRNTTVYEHLGAGRGYTPTFEISS